MEVNKKSHKKKIIILLIFIAIMSGAYFYVNSLLNKVNYVSLDEEQELSISQDVPKYEENKIINVLLFGLDSRVEGQRSRSDSIMIATLDTKEKKIKLTSLMRDTYVSIPGRQDNRINAAYAIGGPELAIRTINENYDMNIEKYVTVDFFSLERIIDKLGGVEVEIKDYEVRFLGSKANDINPAIIDGPGTYNLNGRQAVVYSRIRKVGDGDFERTDRQRVILTSLISKASDISIAEAHSLLNILLPEVETNLTKGEIIKFSSIGMRSTKNPVDELRLPSEDTYEHERIRGMAVLVPDMEKNKEILHDFIFNGDSL